MEETQELLVAGERLEVQQVARVRALRKPPAAAASSFGLQATPAVVISFRTLRR
jgi:hypothetical protein